MFVVKGQKLGSPCTLWSQEYHATLREETFSREVTARAPIFRDPTPLSRVPRPYLFGQWRWRRRPAERRPHRRASSACSLSHAQGGICFSYDILSTPRTNHDLSVDQIGHLDPKLPLWYAVQDLCMVQIKPRKHVTEIDRAGHAAPTRQHELPLGNMSWVIPTGQGSICYDRYR